MSHHHDLSAVWNMDALYADLVHVYPRSVSILCLAVRAHPDLPGYNVHKHPFCRIIAGTRHAMAPGLVPHSCGSMFGGWSLRHDQTWPQCLDRSIQTIVTVNWLTGSSPVPSCGYSSKPLNGRGQAVVHGCSGSESQLVPGPGHVSDASSYVPTARRVELQLRLCLSDSLHGLRQFQNGGFFSRGDVEHSALRSPFEYGYCCIDGIGDVDEVSSL